MPKFSTTPQSIFVTILQQLRRKPVKKRFLVKNQDTGMMMINGDTGMLLVGDPE
jgi:hypothetical protein